jgi:hypothetical protein
MNREEKKGIGMRKRLPEKRKENLFDYMWHVGLCGVGGGGHVVVGGGEYPVTHTLFHFHIHCSTSTLICFNLHCFLLAFVLWDEGLKTELSDCE